MSRLCYFGRLLRPRPRSKEDVVHSTWFSDLKKVLGNYVQRCEPSFAFVFTFVICESKFKSAFLKVWAYSASHSPNRKHSVKKAAVKFVKLSNRKLFE